MSRRVFISPKSARKAGRKAVEGRALRFKVEPHFIFNRDGSVDQGYVVSLWSHIGIIHRGFVRQ